MNTVVEQFRNVLAPEVSVAQTFDWHPGKMPWLELVDKIKTGFELEFLQEQEGTYRYRFPGSAIVNCRQIKVVWGAAPDEAPYRQLQAYVELSRIQEGTLRVRLFENMMGSSTERRVYQRVLEERMADMIAYLRKLVA